MENKYNGLRAYRGVRKAMLGTAAGLASLIGPCFELEVNLNVNVQPEAVRVVGMEEGAVTVDGGLGDLMNSEQVTNGIEQVTGILGSYFTPRK